MTDNSINSNQTYSNCKVSGPILYPDKQDVPFNGFAFSAKMGMIHQINNTGNQDWESWLGTQQ